MIDCHEHTYQLLSLKGYTDEPLEKILTHVEEGTVLDFDRWNLKVEPNTRIDPVPSNDPGKTDVSNRVIYFLLCN